MLCYMLLKKNYRVLTRVRIVSVKVTSNYQLRHAITLIVIEGALVKTITQQDAIDACHPLSKSGH